MALLSTVLDQARDWGECALNLAFPWPESRAAEPVRIEGPYCRQCGESFPCLENYGESFVCSRCVDQDWHFEWARAGYRAEGEVLHAIIGFKYRDEYYQHSRLVGWLTEVFDLHTGAGEWHGLVPVPLYHRRHRERGFNQACEIARGLGSEGENCRYGTAFIVIGKRLHKRNWERNARLKNMQGAFHKKPGFDVTGRNFATNRRCFYDGRYHQRLRSSPGPGRGGPVGSIDRRTELSPTFPPQIYDPSHPHLRQRFSPNPITARRRAAKRKCRRACGPSARSAAPTFSTRNSKPSKWSARTAGIISWYHGAAEACNILLDEGAWQEHDAGLSPGRCASSLPGRPAIRNS